jgi:hypothetical protein
MAVRSRFSTSVPQRSAAVSVIERDLEIAEERLEVAIALIGLLNAELEDFDDRRAVIADVVERWRVLDPVARAEYGRGGSRFSPLAMFTWDYVDLVENRDPDDGPEEYEHSQCVAWRDHARRLRGLNRV